MAGEVLPVIWTSIGITVGFVLIILFSALLFTKWFRVVDKSAALGLPVGTIRAIIGLTLVLGFLLLSWSSIYVLLNGETSTVNNLTETQVDNIPGERLVSKTLVSSADNTTDNATEARYDVIVVSPLQEATKDVIKQVFTTISTLVVAVAGFYFGTRAVQVARGDKVTEPLISGIEPDSAPQGKKIAGVKIKGSNFKENASVKLVKKGSKDIQGSELKRVSNEVIEVTFDIPDNTEGDWDVVVTNPDGGDYTKGKGFKVEKK